MGAVIEQRQDLAAVEVSPSASQPVAELAGITKRYRNGALALDGVSLRLHRGEIVGLLGPNGAGKSTAVKLLMGLSAPTAGTAEIFGRDPRSAANRLRTGVMLQVGRAPETLKVREHIGLFRGYYPHPMPVEELVRIAGLEGLENRLFGQLSGGQKQRVLFALALAGDPDLLFLDEPTVGLDIEARRGMWRAIETLAARGTTVLLTTHYLEEADALASRIIVVNRGRIVCEGTPAEIKARGAAAVLHGEWTANLPAAPVKLIHCTTVLTREQLELDPTVIAVEQNARRTTVRSTSPEATLRSMLALDLTLTDLEIVSPALEDAFLALTTHSPRA